MAYKTLEQSDIIALGPDENQRNKAGGILVRVRENVGNNKSTVYEFIQSDGEILNVWGSTTIDDKLNSSHVGRFVSLVFKGMDSGKSGRTFKDIAVGVWDDDDPLTDKMRAWARVDEFYTLEQGTEPFDGEEVPFG